MKFSTKFFSLNLNKFLGKKILERNSTAGVLMSILRNFQEHLFYKTPPVVASV